MTSTDREGVSNKMRIEQKPGIPYRQACLVILLLLACSLSGLVPGQSAQAAEAGFNVGYRILDLSYRLPDGTQKPLTVAVWYPTKAQPQKYNYNRSNTPGNVALNAAVDTQTAIGNPLVVFSHGYSYCATYSSYINQYLASRGYIVAAPDHEDAKNCSIKGAKGPGQSWDTAKPHLDNFPNRPRDTKAVLDEMLRLNQASGSAFYRTINADAVAVSGWSLGGWTAQVVAGLLPEYKAPQVKAALMFAAGTGRYSPEAYRRMALPVMYQLGDLDPLIVNQNPELRRFAYDNAGPPKFLPIIRVAEHYAFSDAYCVPFGTIENCLKYSPEARVVTKYAEAFLDYFVAQEQAALTVLTSSDLGLTSYEYELETD